MPVHDAGVACEMDTIMAIAKRHGLKVIEDAAQGMLSAYKGRILGSIGHLGTYSFHETKNIISGEGGALLVNNAGDISRAEICREKGTDRSRFFRGEVDKYTWRDIGSSYLSGELTAAFLWAQLQDAEAIHARRLSAWQHYHELLEPLEKNGLLRRPIIPDECRHNAHMYFVLLPPGTHRQKVLAGLQAHGVGAVFHYVPLHSSPAGLKYGRPAGPLDVTEDVAARLIRLPLWTEISKPQQDYVVDRLAEALRQYHLAA